MASTFDTSSRAGQVAERRAGTRQADGAQAVPVGDGELGLVAERDGHAARIARLAEQRHLLVESGACGRQVTGLQARQPFAVQRPGDAEVVAELAEDRDRLAQRSPGCGEVVAQVVLDVRHGPQATGDGAPIADLAGQRQRFFDSRPRRCLPARRGSCRPAPRREEGKVVERIRDAQRVAVGSRERQPFVVARDRRHHVTEPVGEAARGLERRLALGGVGVRRGIVEHAPDALQPLAQVTAELPETPHRGRQAQRLDDAPGAGAEVERRAQVVVLALEAVQPGTALDAQQVRLGLLGQRQEAGGVAVAHRVRVGAGGEPLQRVLADRLQHHRSAARRRAASCRTRLWSTSAASPSSTSMPRSAAARRSPRRPPACSRRRTRPAARTAAAPPRSSSS